MLLYVHRDHKDCDAAKTDGIKESLSIQPYHWRVRLQSIVTSHLSFTLFQTATAHWMAGAVTVLYITCCIWNGPVEIDVVGRFNRTAMLTQDPFKIRF